jgi:hypothetical protein
LVISEANQSHIGLMGIQASGLVYGWWHANKSYK